MNRIFSLTILSAAMLALWVQFAVGESATSQPATTQAAAPASQPASRPAKLHEEDGIEPVERPLARRPLLPTITIGIDPKVLGVAPGAAAPTLIREGDYVHGRQGRILTVADSGFMLFAFENRTKPKQPDPPMVLVRCRALQSMEDLVNERGDKFVFTVSGQVLQYRGVNFLLPTMLRPPTSATSQPASKPEQAARTSKAILDKLQSRMHGNVRIAPKQTPAGTRRSRGNRNVPKGVAPDLEAPKLIREGEFIRTRRGRIVQAEDGNQILFVFDSDGPGMADPPMALVPCQLLQSMEEKVRKYGDQIVFVLSGQVLEYRHANYLLPTMMKLAIKRGNLIK